MRGNVISVCYVVEEKHFLVQNTLKEIMQFTSVVVAKHRCHGLSVYPV